jgi:flagellin-like protein
MRSKKGISAIVATVLIILITVAAVAILWTAVIPMIQRNVEFNALDVTLTIVTQGGYTAYDVDKKIASVQVKRGQDDNEMERLRIIFSIDGESVPSLVVAPAPGNSKTYIFNLSGFGEPEKVSVSPVFIIGSGSEKEGSVTSDVAIPMSSLSTITEDPLTPGEDYFQRRIPMSGLVSWWDFEDGFNDSVGENHGVKYGDAQIVDGALELDGVDDYVQIGDIGDMQINESFSVSISYNRYTKDVTDADRIIGDWRWHSDDQEKNGWALGYHINSNSLSFLVEYLNFGGIVKEKTISCDVPELNQWRHATASINTESGAMNLYVNGENCSNTTINDIYKLNGAYESPLRIGYVNVNNGYFNGTIDEVMIYNRALSEEEVSVIYQVQKKS